MATQHDQPDRYGGDGLDFDRDRLTLRFESRELERAFQVDLGSRLGLQYGVGLGLATGQWVAAGCCLCSSMTVSLEPRGTIEVRGRGPMRVLLVNRRGAEVARAERVSTVTA